MQSGIDVIAAERRRQVEAEGWTAAHDDEHTKEELACAAACYATPGLKRRNMEHYGVPKLWPWERHWFKDSSNRIRELAKAGALIAAEIDRLQRLEAKQ